MRSETRERLEHLESGLEWLEALYETQGRVIAQLETRLNAPVLPPEEPRRCRGSRYRFVLGECGLPRDHSGPCDLHE